MEAALWDRFWHLAAHRSELSANGAFVRFDIFGSEVAVFNDGIGAVAFDNRCPHRGTRIYEGSHGIKRFLCPYHGWSYSKGRLFIPKKQSFENCDLSQARLNEFQTAWVGDFLFVSRDPECSVSEQLGELEAKVARISRDIAAVADWNAYPYLCNWKIAVENALEPYHVALIHPDSLNRLRLQPGENEFLGRNSVWKSEVGDERVAKMLKGLRRLFDVEDPFQGYESLYLFPFTMLSSTYGYSWSMQQFYPSAEPDRTHFVSRFYSSRIAEGANPEVVQPFLDSSIGVNRQVFDEDHQICRRVPRDSWTPEPPPFWSKEEEKIIHFRESLSNLAANRNSTVAA